MEKAAIVDLLEEIAELLELKGENAFKVRAYSAGARALETLEEDLGSLIAEERLGEIKGIGKALVDKITTLHETGELKYYDELKASVPEGMLTMLE
ncbi:MAG: histidinol-phosphatase, partial [Verrucomicrobiota bacterium]